MDTISETVRGDFGNNKSKYISSKWEELNSVPGCDAKQHRRVTEFASGNSKSTCKTAFWEEEHRGRMDIRTVETDTCSMDYLCFGHGERPFVIIPGLSVQSVLLSAEAVAAAYRPFTEDHTVYLFDRRKEVSEGYSIADMAGDTAGAMKHLGLKEADICAASQGGMIAMMIAAQYHDLVRKLVLASTTAEMTDERYRVPGSWAALARAGRAEDLFLAFGNFVYPDRVFEGMRTNLLEAAGTVTAGELERFVILDESMKNFCALDCLDRISCPVLVIGSRDDRVLGGEASVQIAEAIPGSILYLYDGYGHAVYDTAPDFTRRMMTFFRQA